MNVQFDADKVKDDPRYKMISHDWQLLKTPAWWALIHRANGCNGYVAGKISEPEKLKHKNCSGCGRKVDMYVLNKVPFLVKMDLVNNAWRPNNAPSNGSR